MAEIRRGIDGTVSGAINGRIDQWAVSMTQQAVPVPGFGDGGDDDFISGGARWAISANGHARTDTDVKTQGTAQVSAGYIGSVLYSGVIVITNARHGASRGRGNSPFSFSGFFKGEPT